MTLMGERSTLMAQDGTLDTATLAGSFGVSLIARDGGKAWRQIDRFDLMYCNDCRGGGAASSMLPAAAEDAKNDGNRAFFDNDDDAAIWHYTKVCHWPESSAVDGNISPSSSRTLCDSASGHVL